ncbi:MAG: peptide deformylase [Candidatus Caldatribacteriota bacterium]|nr:peptide deformylase [Candidatus Caldatribacteriota bacterium]
MAVLEIKTYGASVLREKSLPVDKITPEILELIEDMKETMYNGLGVGLAAPQIGVSKRIFIIDGEEEGLFVLINPVILEREGETTEEEGCLSVPGVFSKVTRSKKVTVEAINQNGEKIKIIKDNLIGRALQHEIDHLEGILFIDRIGKIRRQLLLDKYKKIKNKTVI